MIRKTIIWMAVLCGVYLLITLFAPQSSSTSQTINLNHDRTEVYDVITNLILWERWGPLLDSNDTKQKVSGSRNSLEHQLTWHGESSGRITLVKLASDSLAKFDFERSKGWFKINGTLQFKMEKAGRNTRIVCNYTHKSHFLFSISNYLSLATIDNQLKSSLGKLKVMLDQNKEDVVLRNGVNIQTLDGVNYAIVRSPRLSPSDKNDFITSAYPKIYLYLQDNGLSAKGPPTLWVNYLPGYSQGNLTAAIAISDPFEKNFEYVKNGSDSLLVSEDEIVVMHRGSMEDLPELIVSIVNFLEVKNWTAKEPIIQEFIVGPMHTERETNYKIKVRLPFAKPE